MWRLSTTPAAGRCESESIVTALLWPGGRASRPSAPGDAHARHQQRVVVAAVGQFANQLVAAGPAARCSWTTRWRPAASPNSFHHFHWCRSCRKGRRRWAGARALEERLGSAALAPITSRSWCAAAAVMVGVEHGAPLVSRQPRVPPPATGTSTRAAGSSPSTASDASPPCRRGCGPGGSKGPASAPGRGAICRALINTVSRV